MGIRTALGLKSRSRSRSLRGGDEAELGIEQERSSNAGLSLRVPGILLAIGALVLLIVFLTDTRFEVREVTVDGVHNLSAAQLEESLSIVGHSVFWVGADQISASLTEGFPTLTDVHVEVSLPNHVDIVVQEADVVLVWESDERYWWIGQAGKVWGETDGAGGLTIVHDVAAIAPEPEGYLPLVPVGLVQGLKSALSNQQDLDYSPDTGLLVYVTNARVPVMLGHDGSAEQKVVVLEALLAHLGSSAENVDYIDLRNEDRPVYHLTE